MSRDDEITEPLMARLQDPEGVHAEAWSRTLEQMEAIADDRTSEGWETVPVMAAHTDTVSRDMRDHDRFGLTHIIPNNHVEEFEQTFDPESFNEYLVYNRGVEGFMYAVIEWIDPEHERVILIACRYDMTLAGGMVESAKEEGVLYSYVKTIDGTILGGFAYEDFEPLISRPTE